MIRKNNRTYRTETKRADKYPEEEDMYSEEDIHELMLEQEEFDKNSSPDELKYNMRLRTINGLKAQNESRKFDIKFANITNELEVAKDHIHDYQVWNEADRKPCHASKEYDVAISKALETIDNENIGYYKSLTRVSNILREAFSKNHKDCYSPEYLECIEARNEK